MFAARRVSSVQITRKAPSLALSGGSQSAGFEARLCEPPARRKDCSNPRLSFAPQKGPSSFFFFHLACLPGSVIFTGSPSNPGCLLAGEPAMDDSLERD